MKKAATDRTQNADVIGANNHPVLFIELLDFIFINTIIK